MTKQSISIAISTKDRRKDLTNLLDSLRKLNYPKDKLEIVVVEEGDKPEPIKDVKYIFIPRLNKGFSYTRNIAFQNCSHKLIAFVDDDCEVTPDWLNELIKHLKDDVSGISGSVKVKDCNTIGLCENILGHPGGGLKWIHESNHKTRPSYRIVTCNVLLKSEAIRAAGGFDNSKYLIFGGEDAALAASFVKNDFKLIYNPNAVVFHKPRGNFTDIFKWAFRMGKGSVLLNKYLSGNFFSFKYITNSLLIKIILFIMGLFIFQDYFIYYMLTVLIVYFLKIDHDYKFHKIYIKKLSIFFILPIVKIAFDFGNDIGRIYGLLFLRKT